MEKKDITHQIDAVVSEIDEFIRRERKICWEAAYQKGEYCIGEKTVRKFIVQLLSR